MSVVDPAGTLRVELLVRGGVVRDVTLTSTRPVTLAGGLVGHPAAAVPAMMERLYAVCGCSQRIAAAFAIAEARNEPFPADARRMAAAELAQERIAAHLRATVVGFPDVAPSPAEFAAIRTALASGEGQAAALAALGIPDAAPRSWAARLLAACNTEPEPVACDPLGPGDDAEVVAALRAGGATFQQAPTLPGRRPETGAYARGGLPGPACPQARLWARFAEIAAGVRETPEERWIAARRLGPGEAFAAVETPRGRLYHLVGVDGRGRLSTLRVLAPTEWNFHADGPFVRALRGRRAGGTREIQNETRRIAGLFDPCVAVDVSVNETTEP